MDLSIYLLLATEKGGVGSVVDEPVHQVTIAQLPLNSLPKYSACSHHHNAIKILSAFKGTKSSDEYSFEKPIKLNEYFMYDTR